MKIATLATVRGFLIMFAALNLKVGSSLCGQTEQFLA